MYEHEGFLHGQDEFTHSLPVVACSFEAQGLALDELLLAAVVAGNREGTSVVELDLRYCTAASAQIVTHCVSQRLIITSTYLQYYGYQGYPSSKMRDQSHPLWHDQQCSRIGI